MNYQQISVAIRATALMPRGGLHPVATDGVPSMPHGDTRTLILVGNVGESMWDAFRRSHHEDRLPDPLDTWTQEVMSELAQKLSAYPLFPFQGPPFLPFQRWARRAESVWPSALGLLIHPDYGLWHAYRGALAFAEHIHLPPVTKRASPCDTCKKRPCLSICPVGAFKENAYDVPLCVAHIATGAGRDCMERSCRARRACPIGRDYLYQPAQARFHMEAFLGMHREQIGASKFCGALSGTNIDFVIPQRDSSQIT